MKKSGCMFQIFAVCLAIALTHLARNMPKHVVAGYLREVLEELYKKEWAYHD